MNSYDIRKHIFKHYCNFMSYITSKTVLTFSLIIKNSFIIQYIVNLVWYIVQSAVYGSIIAKIFKLEIIGELIAMVLMYFECIKYNYT